MTTNQNNKKKNTAARKLIPAIGMLTVSAMMLSSSTYAWFTMNKTVMVTGMEVKTKVGANLLICDDNVASNYKSDTLGQTRQALLEPVSSINGIDGSFFYTVDAAADGSKVHATTGDSGVAFGVYNESDSYTNAPSGKNKYDATFNSVYSMNLPDSLTATGYADGAPAYGYVDYTFYLKATGETANQTVNMSKCNLVYNASADAPNQVVGSEGGTADKAWRVAVFSTQLNSAVGGTGVQVDVKPSSSADNQVGLLKLSGATEFTPGSAVAKASDATSALATIVNKANGVSPNNNGVIIGTLTNQGDTNYYKVVVRLWLEGEDTTCNSTTYAKLGNQYKLDLEFKLSGQTGSDPVNSIGTVSTVAATIESTSPTQSGTNYYGS